MPNSTLENNRSPGQPVFFPDGEHVFAHTGIPFFNTTRRLRADIYRPAQSVSIDVIGDSNSTPTYGRLEAFDAAGNSLRMIRTAPLGDGVRQRLTIDMGSDVIAYAVAYPDNDFRNSSPFGKLDRLAFQVPEAMAVAGSDGVATLNYLDPGQYTIVPGETLGEDYVFDSPSFEITKYENYDFSVPAEINQPPVIEEATFSVPERSITGTVVGTVIATDHPSQTLRYAIVSGGERFSINAATGDVQVRSGAVLDFEATPSYTITVSVTDDSNTPLSSERDFAINLTDINEAPSLPNYEFTVPEHSPKNTVIGTVNAVDLDAGENGFVRYRITGPNPGQAFSIDASTGELKVNSAAYFDFETRTEATITIEAFDAGFPSLTDSGTVKVVLSNVNEAPQIVTQTLAVGELAIQGDSVGLVRVLDPETSQSHTFAWAEGFTTDTFVINANSGEVTVAEGAILSFAEQPEIVISVRATDNGVPAMSVVREITVQVFDQNNPPEIQDLDLSVDENSPGGTLLGTATVRIVPGDFSDPLVIDPTTGIVRLAEGANLDFETNAEYLFTVEVTDGVSPPAMGQVKVSVQDVNEAPESNGELDPVQATGGTAFQFTLPTDIVTATDSGTPALSVDLPIMIEVAVNETPWTNIGIPTDVNGDGNVRGIDALIIINFLNTNKNFEIPLDIDYRPAFLDVNGNNSVEPIDALRVINFLNEVPPSGEGESPSLAASAAIALAQTDALGIHERNERERRRAVDLAITELFD